MNWPWDKMKVNSQICFQQDPDKEVEDSNLGGRSILLSDNCWSGGVWEIDGNIVGPHEGNGNSCPAVAATLEAILPAGAEHQRAIVVQVLASISRGNLRPRARAAGAAYGCKWIPTAEAAYMHRIELNMNPTLEAWCSEFNPIFLETWWKTFESFLTTKSKASTIICFLKPAPYGLTKRPPPLFLNVVKYRRSEG